MSQAVLPHPTQPLRRMGTDRVHSPHNSMLPSTKQAVGINAAMLQHDLEEDSSGAEEITGDRAHAHLWAATHGLPAASRISHGPSAAASVTVAPKLTIVAATVMRIFDIVGLRHCSTMYPKYRSAHMYQIFSAFGD